MLRKRQDFALAPIRSRPLDEANRKNENVWQTVINWAELEARRTGCGQRG